MRAIIVRHYKTEFNLSKQIMGWGDSPPVNSWRADIDFITGRLRQQEINFDAIYSSNLDRARQTATCYKNLLGIAATYDTLALNEVNYGKLYKKKKKWVAANYPQHKKDPDFIYPDGESFGQMQQRSVAHLTSLAKAHPQQTVLIVCHAGVIRGLISYFLGLHYADNLKRKIPHGYIGDFQFTGASCTRYEELGKPSGFIRDGIVETPVIQAVACNSKIVGESAVLSVSAEPEVLEECQ